MMEGKVRVRVRREPELRSCYLLCWDARDIVLHVKWQVQMWVRMAGISWECLCRVRAGPEPAGAVRGEWAQVGSLCGCGWGGQALERSACAGMPWWCQAAGFAHQDLQLLQLPPWRGEVSPRRGEAATSLACFCVTGSLQELPLVVLGLNPGQSATG